MTIATAETTDRPNRICALAANSQSPKETVEEHGEAGKIGISRSKTS
jgi:hypothetical protein